MDELTNLIARYQQLHLGYILLHSLALLCDVGIYFTLPIALCTDSQICSGNTFRGVSLRGSRADKHGMSSFQSVATTTAAQLGTGNLAEANYSYNNRRPGGHLLDVDCGIFRHGNYFH